MLVCGCWGPGFDSGVKTLHCLRHSPWTSDFSFRLFVSVSFISLLVQLASKAHDSIIPSSSWNLRLKFTNGLSVAAFYPLNRNQAISMKLCPVNVIKMCCHLITCALNHHYEVIFRSMQSLVGLKKLSLVSKMIFVVGVRPLSHNPATHHLFFFWMIKYYMRL